MNTNIIESLKTGLCPFINKVIAIIVILNLFICYYWYFLDLEMGHHSPSATNVVLVVVVIRFAIC